MFNFNSSRIISEQHDEIARLRAEILRWRDGRDQVHQELGGLRSQNVQLHRDNSRLAHEIEMVLVQLAVANDERVALLRSRGVPVNDPPTMTFHAPDGSIPRPVEPAWGTPLEDEHEKANVMASVEAASNASLFEDPGDMIAETLGRQHNEFGEVEFHQGR